MGKLSLKTSLHCLQQELLNKPQLLKNIVFSGLDGLHGLRNAAGLLLPLSLSEVVETYNSRTLSVPGAFTPYTGPQTLNPETRTHTRHLTAGFGPPDSKGTSAVPTSRLLKGFPARLLSARLFVDFFTAESLESVFQYISFFSKVLGGAFAVEARLCRQYICFLEHFPRSSDASSGIKDMCFETLGCSGLCDGNTAVHAPSAVGGT